MFLILEILQVKKGGPAGLFTALWELNDKSWSKLTPRFLTVLLEDKVMPFNFSLRCFEPNVNNDETEVCDYDPSDDENEQVKF